MSKSERFIQIEGLLLDHPEGLRRVDIARRLGVHKSTISRDITAMSVNWQLLEEDDGYIRIDKKGFLHTVRLTMFELEALHLSARLFSKVMRFPFPHASAALRKLADAQGKVSPALADRIRDTAEELDGLVVHIPREYSGYRKIIEDLGVAISEKRPVLLNHYSRSKRKYQEFRIFPITLEPHHEGRAVHLIGWDLGGDPPFFRTIKTERIESIVLEEPSLELFDEIPIERLPAKFKDAWSIWTSETEPELVRLRFSAAVADRVGETHWHGSQTIERRSDGGMVWTARIAEPREMYPWIRGWGPDVEVLAPPWLREMHRSDFRKGLEVYGKQKKKGQATDDMV